MDRFQTKYVWSPSPYEGGWGKSLFVPSTNVNINIVCSTPLPGTPRKPMSLIWRSVETTTPERALRWRRGTRRRRWLTGAGRGTTCRTRRTMPLPAWCALTPRWVGPRRDRRGSPGKVVSEHLETGSPLHREYRENGPKNSLSGKTQGIWKFFPNTANLVCSRSQFHNSKDTGYCIIIPLCSNELRLLNPYRGAVFSEIPARFDSAGTSPSLPGELSCAGDKNKRRKSAARWIMIANFRVFWLYFRVNSVEKFYRKAFINNSRENKTKIQENTRKSAVVE